MSKKLVLLVFLILFSTIASADYWSYLTKGLADTLYCKLTGCRMEGDINMGNHSIINATWVNMTYINAEEIVGLADKIDNATIFRTNKGGTINAGVNITKNLNITQGNISISRISSELKIYPDESGNWVFVVEG